MNSEYPVQCPHCGHHFGMPLKPIEQQILDVVAKEARIWGRAKTQRIAIVIGLSHDQALRYCLRLEQRGIIQRVGIKIGWRLVNNGNLS